MELEGKGTKSFQTHRYHLSSPTHALNKQVYNISVKVYVEPWILLIKKWYGLWSTDTPQIRCVPVSDTRRCQTPTQQWHIWLHWIMSFSQIIVGVQCPCFIGCDQLS